MRKKKRRIMVLAMITAFMAVGLFLPGLVVADDPEPPAGPDAAESAMYTIEHIYNLLETGAQSFKRGGGVGFSEPNLPPGDPAGVMQHTLDDVMDIAPEVDDTNGLSPEEVSCGKTFWGLRGDSWGPQEGTKFDPGITEICGDGIDNDCSGTIDIDETRTYYVDKDGDGYGAGDPVPACGEPAELGLVLKNGDCQEEGTCASAFYPGSTNILYNIIGCNGSWDRNCDNKVTKITARGRAYVDNPELWVNVCEHVEGWLGAVPECGQSGNWVIGSRCISGIFCGTTYMACEAITEMRWQECY